MFIFNFVWQTAMSIILFTATVSTLLVLRYHCTVRLTRGIPEKYKMQYSGNKRSRSRRSSWGSKDEGGHLYSRERRNDQEESDIVTWYKVIMIEKEIKYAIGTGERGDMQKEKKDEKW